MHTSFSHQFYKDCQLTFALFKDVCNAKELRQSVVKGEFEAALLKPCMPLKIVLIFTNSADPYEMPPYVAFHLGDNLQKMSILYAAMKSPFQVLVAANEAVHLQHHKKLTTKNVHSEVLFCLSPTKNIMDSFKKFGMGDSDNAVFVVIVNDTDNNVLTDVKSRVRGTEVPVEECANMASTDLIKKIYNVTDNELSSCSLEDALVSRIASKKFGT